MFVFAIWILAGLQLDLVRYCDGLRIAQCVSNMAELDMESSNNEVTCDGVDPTDTIRWDYTDGGSNIGSLTCPPSGSCTENRLFTPTRSVASSSSTVTPLADIKRFRTVYGAMTLTCTIVDPSTGTVQRSVSCQIDAVHRAEVTSCSAQFNTAVGTDWTASGSCVISKAFSQRGRYSCLWTETTSGTSTEIQSSRNFTGSFDEGGVTYRSMTCDFRKSLPRVTGSYSYTAVISPGSVQPGVNFKGSSSIVLPTAHTDCPTDYVMEGDDVDCMCSSTDGNPAGSAVWRVPSGSSRLVLNDVRRDKHGDSYVCEVKWISDKVSNVTFSLQVAYRTKIKAFNLNNMTTHLTVNESDVTSVSLMCRSDGRPTPRMQIVRTRDGSVLKTVTGGSYTDVDDDTVVDHVISPARCEDTGTYMCVSDNQLGPEERQTLSLFVNCVPRRADFPTVDYEGRPVHLSVNMVAFPLPETFTFVFHGPENNLSEPVTSGILDMHCKNMLAAYIATCNITVNTMTSKDAGFYSVRIGNSVGNSTVTFEVKYFDEEPQAGESSSGGLSAGAAVGVTLAVVFVVVGFVVGFVVVWMWRRHWVLPCAFPANGSSNTEYNQAAVSPPVSVEPKKQQNARSNEMPDDDQQAPNQYDILQLQDMGVRSDYAELSHNMNSGMKSASRTGKKQ